MASHRDRVRGSRLTITFLKAPLLFGIALVIPASIRLLGAPSASASTLGASGQDTGVYEEYTGDNNAVNHGIQWFGPGSSKGVGLFLFRVSETGLTQQLFIKTPEGRHLILEKTLRAGSGLDRMRLIDDESGWWFEVTKDYGFTATGLRKFFSVGEDFVSGSGKDVEYTLRTREGLEWKTTIPAQQPREERTAVAEALRGTHLERVLEEHLATDLAEAVAFLSCAPQYDRLGAAAGVLIALWPRPDSAGASWHEEVDPMQPGLALSDPELVKLRAEFVTPVKSLWEVPL